MSTNIEFKARIESIESCAPIAERLSGAPPELLEQTDTYFTVGRGRLKLRQSPQLFDELIFYHRETDASARGCHYYRQRLETPDAALTLLAKTCGIDAIVKKRRFLYLVEKTRVHLDHVEGLGSFLEFEAVLDCEWDETIGHEKVDLLRKDFAIDHNQLIGKSYRELVMELDRSD